VPRSASANRSSRRASVPTNGGWDAAALPGCCLIRFGIAPRQIELASASQIARGQRCGRSRVWRCLRASTTAGQSVTAPCRSARQTGQGWWGGRLSYTFSQTKDNQFAESNGYAWRTATPQNNYDLAAEYSTSIYDSPHRIVLAPLMRLPSPKNQNTLAYTLAGGWNLTTVIEAVSGGPLTAVMSSGTSDANLGLFGGRQRPNLVGDPNTTGSDDDRVASAAHASARYFSSAAFKDPGVGAYGNAPRTDPDARFQFRKNVDLVLSKDTKFGGNQIGQIRFEILNLTNTAKFGNDSNNNAIVNSASFGRVGTQVGFMRIWQLTFRYRF
jgi:hypothetical protein